MSSTERTIPPVSPDAPVEAERQTRCYVISGTPALLSGLEQMLRRIEWVSERGVMRLVCAFVNGHESGQLQARILASWQNEKEEIDEEKEAGSGALLPRLADEETIAAYYTILIPDK